MFAGENARRLAAVRIGLCGLLALRLAISGAGSVAGQPAALFQPLSYMKLFTAMPSPGVAAAAQIVGVVAALLATAGLRFRATLAIALVCELLLQGMLDSTGKVIYNDLVLTLCLLPLLAAGGAATAAWSVGAGRRGSGTGVGEAYGWPVRLAMTIVALAYLFAGLQKLRYSGLDWVTSDNMRWILYASSDAAAHPNPLALFIADHAWMAHLLAGVTLAIELTFPVVLFRPALCWIYLPAIVALHVGIRLAMGLDYSAQWLTAVIVFVDWVALSAWLGRRARPRTVARA